MKYLNNYDRFRTLIKEEVVPITDVDPNAALPGSDPAAATPSPVSGTKGQSAPATQGNSVPEWFKVYDKDPKGFGLNPQNINEYWGIVDELSTKIAKRPFKDVKDLQGFLWSQMNELECNSIDPVGPDGKPIPPMTLLEALNKFRKEKQRGPIDQARFVDGRYGAQTNMMVGAVAKVLLNKLALTDQEKKRVETIAQAVKISTTPGATAGAGLNSILTSYQVEDSNDTIKGAVEKKSNRIKIKDKGDKKLGQYEIDIINDYMNKMGYVLLKVVDKSKSVFHKLFGSKGMKYVWVRNEKGALEAEKERIAREGGTIQSQGEKAKLNETPTGPEAGGPTTNPQVAKTA